MKSATTDTKTLDLGVRSAGIASFISIAKVISLLMGGLMLVIVARIIGPGQYGIYTIATAIIGFGVAFGNIQIGPYFNKHIPKLIAEGQADTVGTLIGDGLLFTVILAVCIMVGGDVMAHSIAQIVFGSAADTSLVYLAMLGIVGAIIYPIVNVILVGLGTGKEIAISTASALIIQAVLSIVLVVMGFGVVGALCGYVASLLLAAAITIYYIHKCSTIRFELKGLTKRLRGILGFSMPLTVSIVISNSMGSFLVVFMALLLIPTSAIGQYGIASRIGGIFDVASGAISVVLIPMFATAIYNKHSLSKISKLYHNSIYYSLVFTLPLMVYASVLSRDVILTVFTSAYNLAIIYMPLISIGVFIGLLWSNAFYLLISLGKIRSVLKFSIAACLLQLVAMIALGVPFGIVGVIIAYYYVGGTFVVFMYFRELRKFRIKIQVSPLLRVIGSNILLGLVFVPFLFLQIRPLYVLFVGVALAIFVYPILLVKTGALSEDEIGVLYHISNEVPVGGSIIRSLLAYSKLFLG